MIGRGKYVSHAWSPFCNLKYSLVSCRISDEARNSFFGGSSFLLFLFFVFTANFMLVVMPRYIIVEIFNKQRTVYAANHYFNLEILPRERRFNFHHDFTGVTYMYKGYRGLTRWGGGGVVVKFVCDPMLLSLHSAL